MYKKWYIAIGALASLLSTTNVYSNPASTDYVKEALSGLRNEVNSQISAFTTATSVNLTQVKKQVKDLPIITHRIGEIFQGGIIFYVDASQQHGLMAALSDVDEEGIEWRNGEGGDRRVNASPQGLNAGVSNTRLIIAEQTIDDQDGKFAALLAANYEIAADGKSSCDSQMPAFSPCYSGWYLPSHSELFLLYTNLKSKGLGALSEGLYWSSSEASVTEAWLIDFGQGASQAMEKSTLAHVRPIHAF